MKLGIFVEDFSFADRVFQSYGLGLLLPLKVFPRIMTTKVPLPWVLASIAVVFFASGNLFGDTAFQVSSLAGNGLSGFANGTGTNGSFSQPCGVAVDGVGTLYVADLLNHSVRKITTNGVISTLAGNGVAGLRNGVGTNALFDCPTGVAVDRAGNVYVADSHNHVIRKISTNGTVTTYAGKGGFGYRDGISTNALFNYPTGVAIDGSGALLVADCDNCTIRRITTNGVVTTLAGNGFPGSTNADGTNAGFSYPQGVSVDASGSVYVADSGNNSIRVIATNGSVSTLAGNGSYGFRNGIGTNASFREPVAVATDNGGCVYVADANNVIRKISSDGTVSNLAGGAWGFADGDGPRASFKYPQGIVSTPSGTIFVADTDNNAIRRILPVFRKASQSIAFPPPAGVTYAPDLQIGLEATASSGLQPVFASASSNGVISGTNFIASGAGTALITATQSGDDTYDAAPSVTVALVISKASNPISFSAPGTRTFSNGDSVYLAATAPGGTVTFVSANTNILTINRTSGIVRGAGTVTIKALQSGNSNYLPAPTLSRSLVINKASQTVSCDLPSTVTYASGGRIPLPGVSSSGLPVVFISGNPAVLAISGTNGVMRKRGTATITAFQPGNANYLGVTNDPVTITLQ